MLRLSSRDLSEAFGSNLLSEYEHLRGYFWDTLVPIISARCLDKTLQRDGSGSIKLASALTLFLVATCKSPEVIAEVGTYIGNSSLAMGAGAGINKKNYKLYTCDVNECIHEPLSGLSGSQYGQTSVINGSSTQMLTTLLAADEKVDMFHVDGRLHRDDIALLKQVIKPDCIFLLDDCEADEKGHVNLHMLRNSLCGGRYVYIPPFTRSILSMWSVNSPSLTGMLIPLSQISITRQ